MHQNVARCRDGDVSRVSLKYDAAECSPGLLSMEWYTSIIVPGCRRMFTLVGEHGMIPLLVPGVFPPVGLSMQARVFFRDTWHHPYIASCFCGKCFYFTCFFAFSGVQAALWHKQSCTEEEAVLTTILYMPFDVVYYLFLCVLLLLCQPGLLRMEWYPYLFNFSMQAHVFFEDTWHHPYISTCLCEKCFYFLCFLMFNGVQTVLWQFQSCLRNNRLKVHRNKCRT